MRASVLGVIAALGIAATSAHAEVPVSLRGSPESMVRQNGVAKQHDLAFVRTPTEIRELEQSGALVRLEGNRDYELANFVSFPHARPEMRTFIERLAEQYRAATGEKLVVTSLTRLASRQPRNSHELSIHPTGIAVDLRVSQRAESRQWLEATLLSLEEQGLLDVTRERTPPHYHIALFPGPYMAHVESLLEREETRLAMAKLETAAGGGASAFVATKGAPLADEPATAGTMAALLAVFLAVPMIWLAAGFRRRRGIGSSD